MTYHLCDLQAPLKPSQRPDRLRQIYLRSIRAKTAKEKAALGRTQSAVNKSQSSDSLTANPAQP